MSPDRAAIILARHKARQIIRQRYRDAGHKLQSAPMRELHADADAWLKAHPELIEQARANLKTFKQTRKARKSRASAVQMLGAKS
jgi:hypothetical protein